MNVDEAIGVADAHGHGRGHDADNENENQNESERAARRSWLERLFLPEVVKGLANTLRHLVAERPFTIQYPEEKLPFNPRSRGEHILKTDENGREKCVACLLCEAACPSRCIRIVPGPSPWPDRERYPVEFEIDLLRCIYCAYCEEACPCDAIELTPKPYTTRDNREGFLYDKERLKRNYPQDWRVRPDLGRGFGKATGAPFSGKLGKRSLVSDLPLSGGNEAQFEEGLRS